ncbi:MAG: hypothetical protein ACM3N3_21320, partial [Betaproteobacteria bacterium]
YGIPATYLIDGAGQALGMKAGPKDWAAREVIEVFRKLVSERGSTVASSSMIRTERAAAQDAAPQEQRTSSARSAGLAIRNSRQA